ncbi:MAG: tRNA (adenosine(37)-N6)-threonylcarbamoyltransferase complex transferase subunit TsaD, partial [Acidimicrobiales bacterium]
MTATRFLAIETSCDETAAAVVDDGRTIVSSVVSSQIDLHAKYGGVVPELASRAHTELIVAVLSEALAGAGLDSRGRTLAGKKGRPIEAVAATVGPGLVGALLVGVSTAKALAMAWKVPFVAVNHLEGHLHAALLEEPALELPVVVLLVSGGHTMLVRMDGPSRYEVIGRTLDDAAGEAFDKVA